MELYAVNKPVMVSMMQLANNSLKESCVVYLQTFTNFR